MPSALIGHTGFVGSTLLKQMHFEHLYRSTNIAEITDRSFDLVVCAGAPAQKWIANREPDADRRGIERLIECLKTIRCKTFVLISTVDVFSRPIEVSESSTVDETRLQPYGLHRRYLEQFVERYFPEHLIVRLPGLVGPGLRKNIIFDFLHGNNLQAIDSRGVFQFYPMVNLGFDLQIALKKSLKLVHMTAEPIRVSEIAEEVFGKFLCQELDNPFGIYDMRSQYAALFGGHGAYQYSKRETIQAIRAYAQSELVSVADKVRAEK